MGINLEEIRRKHGATYSNASLTDVAKDIYADAVAKQYAGADKMSFDEFTAHSGIDEQLAPERAKADFATRPSGGGVGGFVVDLAKSIPRNIINLGNMAGATLEAVNTKLNLDAGLDLGAAGAAQSAKELFDPMINNGIVDLRASKNQMVGEGVDSTILRGVDSAVQSLSTAALGAAAGGLVGGPAGAVAGAGIGMYGTLPLFMGESYNATYNQAIALGHDPQSADTFATRNAMAEGLSEFVSDTVAVFTGGLGKVASGTVKQVVKPTVSRLLSAWGASTAAEFIPEMANAFYQGEQAREMGVEGASGWNSMLDGGGEAFVASLLFGTFAPLRMSGEAHALQQALSSPSVAPEQRAVAAETVYAKIAEADPAAAEAWAKSTAGLISAGKPVPLDTVVLSDQNSGTVEGLDVQSSSFNRIADPLSQDEEFAIDDEMVPATSENLAHGAAEVDFDRELAAPVPGVDPIVTEYIDSPNDSDLDAALDGALGFSLPGTAAETTSPEASSVETPAPIEKQPSKLSESLPGFNANVGINAHTLPEDKYSEWAEPDDTPGSSKFDTRSDRLYLDTLLKKSSAALDRDNGVDTSQISEAVERRDARGLESALRSWEREVNWVPDPEGVFINQRKLAAAEGYIASDPKGTRDLSMSIEARRETEFAKELALYEQGLESGVFNEDGIDTRTGLVDQETTSDDLLDVTPEAIGMTRGEFEQFKTMTALSERIKDDRKALDEMLSADPRDNETTVALRRRIVDDYDSYKKAGGRELLGVDTVDAMRDETGNRQLEAVGIGRKAIERMNPAEKKGQLAAIDMLINEKPEGARVDVHDVVAIHGEGNALRLTAPMHSASSLIKSIKSPVVKQSLTKALDAYKSALYDTHDLKGFHSAYWKLEHANARATSEARFERLEGEKGAAFAESQRLMQELQSVSSKTKAGRAAARREKAKIDLMSRTAEDAGSLMHSYSELAKLGFDFENYSDEMTPYDAIDLANRLDEVHESLLKMPAAEERLSGLGFWRSDLDALKPLEVLRVADAISDVDVSEETRNAFVDGSFTKDIDGINDFKQSLLKKSVVSDGGPSSVKSGVSAEKTTSEDAPGSTIEAKADPKPASRAAPATAKPRAKNKKAKEKQDVTKAEKQAAEAHAALREVSGLAEAEESLSVPVLTRVLGRDEAAPIIDYLTGHYGPDFLAGKSRPRMAKAKVKALVEKMMEHAPSYKAASGTRKPVAMLRSSSPSGKRLDVVRVHDIVESLTAGWKNAPEFRIHFDGSTAPAYFDDGVAAAYDRGVVHIFASEMRSDFDVSRAIVHEVLTHHGLRVALGDGYVKTLEAAFSSSDISNYYHKKLVPLGYSYNLNTVDGRTTAAEEVIAHMVDAGLLENTFVSKVISAFKDFLRAMGFSANYTSHDLRHLVSMSRESVINGKTIGKIDVDRMTSYMMSVWHGSGSREMREFRHEFIGKGEGNAAFGYGFYLTGHLPTADSYAKIASDGVDRLGAVYRAMIPSHDELLFFDDAYSAMSQKVRQKLHGLMDSYARSFVVQNEAMLKSMLPKILDGQAVQLYLTLTTDQRNMVNGRERSITIKLHRYENYHEEQADLVAGIFKYDVRVTDGRYSYDVSASGTTARNAFMAAMTEGLKGSVTGADLYYHVANNAINTHGVTPGLADKIASEHMMSLGIPGHRFLNANRRLTTDTPNTIRAEDHYNYVVYDGRFAELTKEYDYEPSVTFRERVGFVSGYSGTINAAQDAVNNLLSKFGNLKGYTVVVGDYASAPANIRAAAVAQNIAAAYHNGTAYIFTDRHKDINDILRSAIHEIVGHHGLSSLFASRQHYDNFLTDVAMLFPREVQAKLSHTGSKLIAAEEFLCELLEDTNVVGDTFFNPNVGTVLDRLYAAFRTMLRRLGVDISYSKQEVSRTLHAALSSSGMEVRRMSSYLNGDGLYGTIAMKFFDRWRPLLRVEQREGVGHAYNFLTRFRGLMNHEMNVLKNGAAQDLANAVSNIGLEDSLAFVRANFIIQVLKAEPSLEGRFVGGLSAARQVYDRIYNSNPAAANNVLVALKYFNGNTIDNIERFGLAEDDQIARIRSHHLTDIFVPLTPADNLYSPLESMRIQKRMFLAEDYGDKKVGHSFGQLLNQSISVLYQGHNNHAKRLFAHFIRNTGALDAIVYEEGQMPAGTAHLDTLMYKEHDGTRWYIAFNNKELFKAFSDGNADIDNVAFKAMQQFNRFQVKMFIGLNPAFGLRSILRDAVFGTFATLAAGDYRGTSGATIWKNVMRSYPETVKDLVAHARGGAGSALLQEYVRSGALMGWANIGNIVELSHDFNKMVKHKETFIGTLSKVIGGMNEVAENAYRFAFYKQVRAAGYSPAEAAAMSKDISVNFDRAGTFGPALNAIWLFSNASIQTTAKIAKMFKENPAFATKVAGGMILLGFVAAAFGHMVSDDDDYEKLPEYVRENNLVIMIPGAGDVHAKIPLPYGISFLYNIGRNMADISFGSKRPEAAALLLMGSAYSQFSPVGGGGLDGTANSIIDAASPTMLRPFLDAFVLRNEEGAGQKWTGAPIKDGEEWQYIASSLGGGAAKFLIQSTRLVMGNPEDGLNDVPFLNTVVGKAPSWVGDMPNYREFTAARRELRRAYRERQAAKDVGGETWRAYRAEHADEIALGNRLSSLDKSILASERRLKGLPDGAAKESLRSELRRKRTQYLEIYLTQ